MDSVHHPLVSVLMTAYNREKYISEAIESVLASTYKNFELIIVDDGSKDCTVDVAEKYAALDTRINVYVNKKNLGDYANRNKAASYAKGIYLKYLDSDDLMYPHCLEVMISSMEKFPEAGFGLSAKPDSKKPYPVLLTPAETYKEHFNGYGHFDRSPGSAIIKRSAFEKIGGFSGKRWVGDTELWFLLGRKYPMVKMVVDLYFSRLHEDQEGTIEVSKQNATLSSKMRKELFDVMMSHPECPLTQTEKVAILSNIKKNKQKFLLKKLSDHS